MFETVSLSAASSHSLQARFSDGLARVEWGYSVRALTLGTLTGQAIDRLSGGMQP